MPLRSTYRPRVFGVRVNTGRRGVTSVSKRVGPVTFRWRPGRGVGVSSVDPPGPVSWRARAGRR